MQWNSVSLKFFEVLTSIWNRVSGMASMYLVTWFAEASCTMSKAYSGRGRPFARMAMLMPWRSSDLDIVVEHARYGCPAKRRWKRFEEGERKRVKSSPPYLPIWGFANGEASQNACSPPEQAEQEVAVQNLWHAAWEARRISVLGARRGQRGEWVFPRNVKSAMLISMLELRIGRGEFLSKDPSEHWVNAKQCWFTSIFNVILQE
jgi:hypothetical protein